MVVDRDLRLNAQLRVFAHPQNARIDRAGGQPAASVQPAVESKFHDWNHVTERRGKADVFHEGLEIRKAVLQCESPA